MSALIKSGWRILRQAVAGASRALFLFLVSGLWLLVTSTAPALLDTNQNGVSDIWEKTYNGGQLLTTFNPTADPAGDGWTNEQEATAGTNPNDANPPTGYLRPLITHIPAVYITGTNGAPEILTPEAETITWPTTAGKLYSVQASPDLTPQSWLTLDTFIGNGASVSTSIQLTQPDGSIPDKLFWRVSINDTDTDGDTLTDAEEHTLGTNPNETDTDGDGLTDLEEAILGTDPDNADTDGDGISDKDEVTNGTNPTSDDTDGDLAKDGQDADPNDPLIDWPPAPESSYVLIEVDAPPDAGAAMDINDKGEVLFSKGIWKAGIYTELPDVSEVGVTNIDTGSEQLTDYALSGDYWSCFNANGMIVGSASGEVYPCPAVASLQLSPITQSAPPDNHVLGFKVHHLRM